MAILSVNGGSFDIDLVIFDKDGTLVDFDQLWGSRIRRGVDTLVQRVGGDGKLSDALYRTMGYLIEEGRAAPGGPLAVTTTAKLQTLAAAVLYQHGYAWEMAEEEAGLTIVPALTALTEAGEIRPLGDVGGLFRRLRQAGVKIAVATSDDRKPTESALSLLGVRGEVCYLVCGDDDVPNKPSPEAITHVANHCQVAPSRMMMVGDTVSDMRFGRNGKVACTVGVTAGAGERSELAQHADILVTMVDEIRTG